jgi:hypothetical protein
MSKAEELARVQVLLDTYADECFSDGKEIGGRVPSDRTLAARKALMDGISRLAGANPPAKIEQAAEPVAVFKEDKSFGHVEFIPFQGPPLKEGDKLHTNPAPRKPMTKEHIDEVRKALTFDIEDLPEPWAFREGVRAAERFHDIKE